MQVVKSSSRSSEQADVHADLIVDVCVCLSPCQVVPEDRIIGVANSSAIKDWEAFEGQVWKELAPALHKGCCEG